MSDTSEAIEADVKRSAFSCADEIHLAVSVLNEALAADPASLATLFAFESPCNEALSDHWSAQVGPSCLDPDGEDGGDVLRVMGLLNGLFGVDYDRYGHIALRYVDMVGMEDLFKEQGIPPPILCFECRGCKGQEWDADGEPLQTYDEDAPLASLKRA